MKPGINHKLVSLGLPTGEFVVSHELPFETKRGLSGTRPFVFFKETNGLKIIRNENKGFLEGGDFFLEGAGFDGVKRKPTATPKNQLHFVGASPKRDDTQKDTKESSREAGLAPRFPKLGALKDPLPAGNVRLTNSTGTAPIWGCNRPS